MTLKGKKPTEIEKRLKLLLYGSAGVGKTFASIQFPAPYLIDTERGAEQSQYIEMLEKTDGMVYQTDDFDDILTEVKTLLTEKHKFKTLIIDPLTPVYSSLLEQSANKLKSPTNPEGTAFGAHYGVANKQIKHLLNLLTRLDMNVIITSHAKNEYGDNLSVLGQTFDCYKKLDYLFDLVLELRKEEKQRVALVKKSRIKTFEEAEHFYFSYKEIATRYGKDIIEKEIAPEVLATKDQIAKIHSLVDLLKIPAETTQKWLLKAQSESFAEMSQANIQKCIDHLNEKINQKEKRHET